jgi:MFS family permease
LNEQDSGAMKARPPALVLITLVAATGGFLFGYETAVINGANQYLKAHFGLLSPAQEGIPSASAILGRIPGAMAAGFLSDRFGRRKVLFLCAVLYAVSGVLSALPRTFVEFLAARFISGLGIGVSSMVCPIYLAELAPADRRGRLGSLFQLGIVLGIFLTLFINAWIQGRGDAAWNAALGWRWMLATDVIAARADRPLGERLGGVAESLHALCAAQGVEMASCAGVGLSYPSIIDTAHARILDRFGKFGDATTLDLRAWAQRTLGLPLAIDNDARLALVGEWRHGAARGCDNVVMMTLGAGLGTAAIPASAATSAAPRQKRPPGDWRNSPASDRSSAPSISSRPSASPPSAALPWSTPTKARSRRGPPRPRTSPSCATR